MSLGATRVIRYRSWRTSPARGQRKRREDGAARRARCSQPRLPRREGLLCAPGTEPQAGRWPRRKALLRATSMPWLTLYVIR